uniref:Glycosyl hydrolase n=1 Tax=Roseihalotalea indica TaxID=2867963 RepID=A0AA49JFN8_9BACT|nr:glycosyl hydrolase [Tunicatimonas sp. TK19036]
MADSILVGTAKGLVQYQKGSGGDWKEAQVYFQGFDVSLLYVDKRINRWWVGLSHKHWGEKLHFSDDAGTTWQETAVPTLHNESLPTGKPAKLRQLWCMQQGGDDQPDTLWLGTDPGALFKSEDQGESFHLVRGLWDHPSRQQPGQWFGAGSDTPFIHSIVVDPQDSHHVYVAVSCAGVFETTDGGHHWHPRNQGLVAAYLPNPEVEVGHDPHCLLMPRQYPNVLWQQNHCGIYYSENGGIQWQEVSDASGIPYYGFALAVDDKDPRRAWVIPAESDAQRVAAGLALRVFQTNNQGRSWESVSDGLPQQQAFDLVLRQAFAKQNKLMVFGTNNGNLYLSDTERIHWRTISYTLPKVNSVIII